MSLRVLVVEDSPVEQRLTGNRVTQAGFEATTVSAVHEAAAIEADVALLDLGLGRTDGLTSLETFCQVCPDMPVVVLTGNDNDDVARAAIRCGAQDYLVKHEINVGALRRSLLLAVERCNSLATSPGVVEHLRVHPDGVVLLFDQPHEQVLADCADAGVSTSQAQFVDMTQRTQCPILSHDGITLIGSPVQLERGAVHALRALGRSNGPLFIDAPHMVRIYAGEAAANEFLGLIERHAEGRLVVGAS